MLAIILILAILIPGINVYPSTIAPVTQQGYANINGYGVEVGTESISLGQYYIIHTSRKGDGLLNLDGGVYQKENILYQLSIPLYKNDDYSIRAGINMINDNTGYMIYGEKLIGELVRFRLTYRQIYLNEEIKQLSIDLGVKI